MCSILLDFVPCGFAPQRQNTARFDSLCFNSHMGRKALDTRARVPVGATSKTARREHQSQKDRHDHSQHR
jgi:hypothetical protein